MMLRALMMAMQLLKDTLAQNSLAARFTVRNSGRVVYGEESVADARWESSFVGAVAVPSAMNQYGALYKALISKLVDDPDFRLALAR